MFDPHRTRRNDRRFYTKKGQVIQAKNLNAPFTIERNKVEAYKQYILKNHLVTMPSELPLPVTSFNIIWTGGSFVLPISSLAYLRESYTNNTPQGDNMLNFSVTRIEGGYNFKIFVTSNGSVTFPADSWFVVYPLPLANKVVVNFQSGDQILFAVASVRGGQINSVQDLELPDSIFFIDLNRPAPSE